MVSYVDNFGLNTYSSIETYDRLYCKVQMIMKIRDLSTNQCSNIDECM